MQRLRKIKLAIISFLATFLVLSCANNALATSNKIDASAALMADADTGQVIYQQNAQQKLPVASVSKLLTACVIEDEIHDHQLRWNDQIKINHKIAAISNDPSYSAVGLKEGQEYSVRELYQAMLIKSADGAAMALATAHGQKMTTFNHKMEKKAQQIGLRHYSIVNPVGLNNEDMKDFAIAKTSRHAQNAMTAQDVALLAQTIIQDYPSILNITKQAQNQITIKKGDKKQYANSNQMLPGQHYAPQGVTIDGLKTGTSDEAGACFVSTGTYQGHRIITVVLHANGKDHNNRFVQTQKLYQYLQTNVHPQSLTIAKSAQQVAVKRGQPKQMSVQPQSITVWVSQNISDYSIQPHYRQSLLAGKQRLQAPLKKHQRVGVWQVNCRQLQTLDQEPIRVPIYTSQAVKKTSLFGIFK